MRNYNLIVNINKIIVIQYYEFWHIYIIYSALAFIKFCLFVCLWGFSSSAVSTVHYIHLMMSLLIFMKDSTPLELMSLNLMYNK